MENIFPTLEGSVEWDAQEMTAFAWMRARSLRPGPLTFAIIPVAAVLFIGSSLKHDSSQNGSIDASEPRVILESQEGNIQQTALYTAKSKVTNRTRSVKHRGGIDWSKESVESVMKSLEGENSKLQNRNLMLSVKVKKLVAQLSEKVSSLANHSLTP